MASKFIAIFGLFAVTHAALMDYSALNNRLQQHQQQQQQLNYEMQLENNRHQDYLNQQHLENEQRQYLENQRKIQLYQEWQQQQNHHLQNINNNQLLPFLEGRYRLNIQHPTSTSTQYFVKDSRQNAPVYEFGYSVNDDFTGDRKVHHERANGDYVQGHYSLIDADGLTRTVDYKVDDHNGFQANVSRKPVTLVHKNTNNLANGWEVPRF
jgi:hypothetical protein